MILKENLSQVVDVIGEDIDELEYGINASDMGMAVKLYYQYSDAISSIVRECASNAVDSHKEASMIAALSDKELKQLGYVGDLDSIRDYFSTWEDRPVVVRVVDNGLLNDNVRKLEIVDFGVGLSPIRMKKVFTKFFASTKRHSNKFIGAYGLGSKSPLGYCDMFLITTVYLGVKYEYAVHVAKEAPILKLISQENTSEPNGSIFTVPIKNERDLESFRKAVCTQLMYFDNLLIEGVPGYSSKPIMRGEHFIFREDSQENLHLCLGKVYYPLSNNHFNISGRKSRLPVGLRFDVGELDVVWNREAIEYTTETIDAINKKMELVSEELQTLWDNKYSNLDTIGLLAEAAGSIKDRSMDIEGMDIPEVDGWISRNVVYSKQPALGRFKDARFLSCVINVDRVVNDGRTRQVSRYSTLISLEETAFIWDPIKDKSDPFVNEYIYMEKGLDSFYLASWVHPEKAASEIFAYSIDRNRSGHNYQWGTMNDADQQKYVDFAKEVMIFLNKRFKKYGRHLVPQEWIDERILSKKAKAKAIKAARASGQPIDLITKKAPSNVEMPYKMLRVYGRYRYRSSWHWKMGTLFFKDLNGPLGEWIKHGLHIIYGTKEEKERIQELYEFLVGNQDFLIHYDKNKTLFNGNPMFVLVARNNRQYLSVLPNAFNLAEYQCRLRNLLIKVKTAKLIRDAVGKLVNPNTTAISRAKGYQRIYQDLHSYVSRYYQHAHGDFYDFRESRLPLDKDIIKKLWQAVAIIRRYPMLEYVAGKTFYPDNVALEFQKYFRDKGEASPYLHMRLAEFKKRVKNLSTRLT